VARKRLCDRSIASSISDRHPARLCALRPAACALRCNRRREGACCCAVRNSRRHPHFPPQGRRSLRRPPRIAVGSRAFGAKVHRADSLTWQRAATPSRHGSSSGRRLRLRGEGACLRRAAARCDLYAVVSIKCPQEARVGGAQAVRAAARQVEVRPAQKRLMGRGRWRRSVQTTARRARSCPAHRQPPARS